MSDKFKIKVSKNATFKELEAAYRDATGNPDFNLPQEEYDQFVNLNAIESEEREKIKAILGKYYMELEGKEDSESLKRKDELMDVARLILFLKDDVKLISMGESPDFIIEINGEKIGIEHTRFYDKQFVAMISNLEKACKICEQALVARFPEEKRMFNVQFDYGKIAKLDRKMVAPILTEYLFNYLFDAAVVKPEIIEKISVSSHSTMEVTLSEQYLSKRVNTADLDALISQKEAKLIKYRANCGLNTIWLLVIVDGDSEKSDHDLSPEILPQRDFGFDSVFVFNTFKNICLSSRFGRSSSI